MLGWSTNGIQLSTECQIICRVFFLALGKELFCRVPIKKLLIKKSANKLFNECYLALGKELLCECFLTLVKEFFARCFFNTRQFKKN